MKYTLIFITCLSGMVFGQQKCNNQVDSVSYLIGNGIGKNVLQNMPEVNKELLIQGIMHALKNQNAQVVDSFDMVISNYFQEKQAIEAEAQMAKGEAFLAEIRKTVKGIKETESGLLYVVEKMGKGKKPISTSMVKVHYTGYTPEGEKFDSSVDRGEPAEFGLDQVITGWTEGLQLMPVGSKFKFYIPQDLAYGEMAPEGSPIKPFMPLVFEVELLDIIE
jgi:FKBP-type peptidyl-prolyl cis-trans isomerase